MLLSNANVYVYHTDTDFFDKISLAWYMSSGKFIKNSMARWTAEMTKLKAQIIRASVDNSTVLLPTDDNIEPGHLVIVALESRVFAVGISKSTRVCPAEYRITNLRNLLAVRIVATSFAKEVDIDELPSGKPGSFTKIVDDVADAIDVDVPEVAEVAYELNVLLAHRYRSYVETLKTIETPIRVLEIERQRRLDGLTRHLAEKKPVLFPKTTFDFSKMMKTHAKFGRLFGRIK
jgi:hypothetical protein